jgi:hypothetical protein
MQQFLRESFLKNNNYCFLPIYKEFYAFNILLIERIRHFDRLHKHITGDILLRTSLESFQYIISANNSIDSEKSAKIQKLINNIDTLNIILRLCQDVKILSKKHYVILIELLDNTNQQAKQWFTKYCK